MPPRTRAFRHFVRGYSIRRGCRRLEAEAEEMKMKKMKNEKYKSGEDKSLLRSSALVSGAAADRSWVGEGREGDLTDGRGGGSRKSIIFAH